MIEAGHHFQQKFEFGFDDKIIYFDTAPVFNTQGLYILLHLYFPHNNF